ncbi:hypothetical protein [Arthrobacter bambusae]|uniref:hypothetical protein n=1 Tax=Arthrobacter bambusae TaxID=1338426 RepID=UPI00277F30C8|nr:hypothetical protein [Arthrobacter bambusae]MDQ0028771.1 hypothetical protein [Arthrobacter bambusae]MDQ0096435.1 hypothetical protein [Arthrobacter bambusae]
MSQVIHGGFTNLHRHSVPGALNRSVVPVRKPVLDRTVRQWICTLEAPGRGLSRKTSPVI